MHAVLELCQSTETAVCADRRFPKGDHEMFDLHFMTKVRNTDTLTSVVTVALWLCGYASTTHPCMHVSKRCAAVQQEHEVEHAYGTVIAAICFCSFIYPIATPSLPADRA